MGLGRKWPMSSARTATTFWLCGSGYSPAHRGKPSTIFVIAAQPPWVAMCSITIAGIAPSLTIRVLWGVIPYGELNAVTGAKATTRSPFFSPLRTWDCHRRAAPVGRIFPDRMPQMIRSRLVVKVAMRPSLRDRHAGDVPAVFEITTGMDTDHRIAICGSQPQKGRFVMGSRQPTTTA